MKVERVTTVGMYGYDNYLGEWEADDPVTPDGEGWRMEGTGMDRGMIAWFWVREVPERGVKEGACTCPVTCDCQSPETEPALVSNLCPIHNLYPDPDYECPVHGDGKEGGE